MSSQSISNRKRYEVSGLEDEIPATKRVRTWHHALVYASGLKDSEIRDLDDNRRLIGGTSKLAKELLKSNEQPATQQE